MSVVETEAFEGLRGGPGTGSRCLVARCQSEEAVGVNWKQSARLGAERGR